MHSKMLHSTKVIILVEKKKKKRWPGWGLNSRPPHEKVRVLTITPWIIHRYCLDYVTNWEF